MKTPILPIALAAAFGLAAGAPVLAQTAADQAYQAQQQNYQAQQQQYQDDIARLDGTKVKEILDDVRAQLRAAE